MHETMLWPKSANHNSTYLLNRTNERSLEVERKRLLKDLNSRNSTKKDLIDLVMGPLGDTQKARELNSNEIEEQSYRIE